MSDTAEELDAKLSRNESQGSDRFTPGGGGGGVLHKMGYIGMCGPKGYGFSAVLVINRVSIIAIFLPLWS